MPSALYFVAHEINQHPDARLIDSDEDKLNLMNQRMNAHFKSDWNWPLFLAQNFFSHLGVFEAELVKELGFRSGFEGSQDYDLVLRCVEKIKAERNSPHPARSLSLAHVSAECCLKLQRQAKRPQRRN